MSTPSGNPSEVKLLDDIVNALIRQHDIVPEDLTELDEASTECRVWQIAFEKAVALSPVTLGRIACAVPSADLYGWHNGTWLGKYERGPYLLQQIAATAMICHMEHLLGTREYAPEWWTRQQMPHWFGPVRVEA